MQALSELLGLPIEAAATKEPRIDRIKLTPASLRDLNSEQLAALLSATQFGDVHQLEELIALLPVESAVKAALTELVDDFQYDQLQLLFAPSKSHPSDM